MTNHNTQTLQEQFKEIFKDYKPTAMELGHFNELINDLLEAVADLETSIRLDEREKTLSAVIQKADEKYKSFKIDEAIGEIITELRCLVSKKGENGDLLSDCCKADFDPLGFEREDGSWQEKCLRCGKLCDPVWTEEKELRSLHPKKEDRT